MCPNLIGNQQRSTFNEASRMPQTIKYRLPTILFKKSDQTLPITPYGLTFFLAIPKRTNRNKAADAVKFLVYSCLHWENLVIRRFIRRAALIAKFNKSRYLFVTGGKRTHTPWLEIKFY